MRKPARLDAGSRLANEHQARVVADEIHGDLTLAPGEDHTPVLSLPRSLTVSVVMLMSPSKTFSEPDIQAALALAPNPLNAASLATGSPSRTSRPARPRVRRGNHRQPHAGSAVASGDEGVHMGERQACCCRRAAGTAATAPIPCEWPSPVRAPSLTTRWNGWRKESTVSSASDGSVSGPAGFIASAVAGLVLVDEPGLRHVDRQTGDERFPVAAAHSMAIPFGQARGVQLGLRQDGYIAVRPIALMSDAISWQTRAEQQMRGAEHVRGALDGAGVCAGGVEE